MADGRLTEQGRAGRSAIEERTDAQERSIVDALGDRLDDICGRLGAWGAGCVEVGSFPADVLKRAAG